MSASAGASNGRQRGRFVKGHQRPPPGPAMAIVRDLRRGIIEPAIRHGADGQGRGGLRGYLTFLAGEHPAAFARLLRRVVPRHPDPNFAALVAAVASQYLADQARVRAAQPTT